jgi:DNA repair protein RecN (Recombination protein N)
MLSHLHIRDFAIIESVELDVRKGLTVLTGETGAGKSILVDALQLAIGGRAGAEVIRHGADRAEITATFELAGTPKALREWLNEQSIEIDEELVVRRVIQRDGKSRAYLNGQTVAVQLLRQAGEWLADIHGQHEFQSLMRSHAQRELLDTYAGATALCDRVADLHRERVKVDQSLEDLLSAARDRDSRLELLRHQLNEWETLALKEGELATLMEERQRLTHGAKLADAARVALELIDANESSNAHALAARALNQVRQVAHLDAALAETLPALEESVIRLRDVAGDLTRYLDKLEADPGRQELVEQRLATIESLARKHRVAPEGLPTVFSELAVELERLEKLEQHSGSLTAERDRIAAEWRKVAEQLGKQRRKAAEELATDITQRMQGLGMIGGEFRIALHPQASTELTQPYGAQNVEFQVSANAGQPPRPLAKVASGGELSRLSLAVQVALAARATSDANSAACMVFDEVDSGVGGAVAEIVGRELATLAESAQVLCVTHLPQVAALGTQHLQVRKQSDGKRTQTGIRDLQGAERVEEIARMLGGVTITDTAREHAAEMLRGGISPPRSRDAGSSSSGSVRKSRGRGR